MGFQNCGRFYMNRSGADPYLSQLSQYRKQLSQNGPWPHPAFSSFCCGMVHWQDAHVPIGCTPAGSWTAICKDICAEFCSTRARFAAGSA